MLLKYLIGLFLICVPETSNTRSNAITLAFNILIRSKISLYPVSDYTYQVNSTSSKL
jgi:hypothetical protein